MLKSIEKLRDGTYNATEAELADEIQAEVDNCYLPLPLFEDGEPAHLGDEFYCPDLGTLRICRIHYASNHVQITQEKIDADSLLLARDYCDKYNLDVERASIISFKYCAETLMRRDLLARQRRLDGFE